jgi:hypothetical protein
MKHYLKKNSKIPEFCFSCEEMTEAPEGYIEVNDQKISELQLAIDENPNGSIVNGTWVPNE